MAPLDTAPTVLDSVSIGPSVDSFETPTPEEVPSRVMAQQVTEDATPRTERRDEMRASASQRSRWVKLAASGAALGGTAQSAGVALERFLTNRAKTLAEKF